MRLRSRDGQITVDLITITLPGTGMIAGAQVRVTGPGGLYLGTPQTMDELARIVPLSELEVA